MKYEAFVEMVFPQIFDPLVALLVDNNRINKDSIEERSEVSHLGLVASEFFVFLLLLATIRATYRGVDIGHPIYAVMFANLVRYSGELSTPTCA